MAGLSSLSLPLNSITSHDSQPLSAPIYSRSRLTTAVIPAIPRARARPAAIIKESLFRRPLSPPLTLISSPVPSLLVRPVSLLPLLRFLSLLSVVKSTIWVVRAIPSKMCFISISPRETFFFFLTLGGRGTFVTK